MDDDPPEASDIVERFVAEDIPAWEGFSFVMRPLHFDYLEVGSSAGCYLAIVDVSVEVVVVVGSYN